MRGPRFSHRAGLAAVFCVAAMFSMAADARGQAPHVRSLTDFRYAGVIRQQWDLSCGAAAIATILTYQLGHPVSEREVALAMLHRTSPKLVRARLGFSLFDLKVYAATLGFGAAGFGKMTLDDLDAIAPAIVPVRMHGFRHFVVYRGRRGDHVLLADPSFGNRTMPEWSFRAVWAEGIGFRVFDPAQPNAPNRIGAPAELFATPAASVRRHEIMPGGIR
jgi:uncharacterized protein